MRRSLQDVADYVRTARAPQAVKEMTRASEPIISFSREHRNRPPRYVAIVEAYRDGMLVEDIQNKFGCSKNTVMRYTRMAGLPIRPRGVPGLKLNILSAYRREEPIAKIAKEFGVSQAYVSTIATEAGINRRKFRKNKH